MSVIQAIRNGKLMLKVKRRERNNQEGERGDKRNGELRKKMNTEERRNEGKKKEIKDN